MYSLRRIRSAAALAAFLAAAPAVRAQGEPHIGYAYPAGGCQGAVVEITIGGENLRGVTGAVISGGGIDAKVIRYTKPLTQQQLSNLTRKIRELTERQKQKHEARKRGGEFVPPDPAITFKAASLALGLDLDLVGYTAMRAKLSDPRRQPNAQLDETVRLYVTLAADAEPGRRELRVKTGRGLSNPVAIHVGPCREYCEKEPNDKSPDAGLPPWLPVVVNGQILPGDVDRFRFRATKGTRLVAAVSARSLMPYLADAVPGWFQATLALFDAKGKEVAYVDDFRFDPDPVIYYEVPETGEYVLEIKDAIFRGREDFVYRIALGELPFVTGIFPLGGRTGAKTTVAVEGWNLPVSRLTLDTEGKGPGILPVSVCKGKHVSNRVPFAVGTLPECLEAEPNSDRGGAQKVKLPLVVNGRIGRPGDWDVFRFDGRAGEEIVAEVHARRLGSPLDSLLKLCDAKGKPLAVNDDHRDEAAGLTTHHADSLLSCKLPKDGTYLLHLGDTQHKGGATHAYRLCLRPRKSDFALRVVPSTLSARTGTIVPITVHALRCDGFAGDISLKLKNNPPGFALGGGWIPAGQDKLRLTLTMPPVPNKRPFRLQLEGTATVEGKEVRRTALPAEDMMQAFLYRHLVTVKEWMVSVSGSKRYGRPMKVLGRGPVKLPADGTAEVRISASLGSSAKGVQLELSEAPEGVTIRKVSPDLKVLSFLLGADKEKVKPGLKGNLIVNAFVEREVKSKDGKPTGRKWRSAMGVLPAIPFEVVAAAP